MEKKIKKIEASRLNECKKMYAPNVRASSKGCSTCGASVPAYTGFSIPVAGKGVNGRVACWRCACGLNRPQALGNSQTVKVGAVESTPVRFKIELEKAVWSHIFRLQASKMSCWLDENRDNVVITEYGQGFNSLSKILMHFDNEGIRIKKIRMYCGFGYSNENGSRGTVYEYSYTDYKDIIARCGDDRKAFYIEGLTK